jgi:hypothetical protein
MVQWAFCYLSPEQDIVDGVLPAFHFLRQHLRAVVPDIGHPIWPFGTERTLSGRGILYRHFPIPMPERDAHRLFPDLSFRVHVLYQKRSAQGKIVVRRIL